MKSHLKASGRVLLAIKGMWYDVTDFMSEHPGGAAILQASSMKVDATPNFLAVHDASLLDTSSVRELRIGRVWQDEDNQTGKGTAYLAARKKLAEGEETKWWDRCTQAQVCVILIFTATLLHSPIRPLAAPNTIVRGRRAQGGGSASAPCSPRALEYWKRRQPKFKSQRTRMESI